MDDEVFNPQAGYRGLDFGMRSADAVSMLGLPGKELIAQEQWFIDDEFKALLEGVRILQFPGYQGFHKEPLDLEFKHDRLVSIHLRDAAVPLTFRGVNLFASDRKSVLAALYAFDNDLYGNSESFFFGAHGIVTPRPKHWRELKYVALVDSEYVFEQYDLRNLNQVDGLGW